VSRLVGRLLVDAKSSNNYINFYRFFYNRGLKINKKFVYILQQIQCTYVQFQAFFVDRAKL